ncbi:probable splicing factor 3A subunit 1 [Tanacetum coccineum]
MNSLFCKQLIRIRSCLATTYHNKLYHIHVSIFKREHTVETGSKDLWSAVKTASGERASGLGLGLSRAGVADLAVAATMPSMKPPPCDKAGECIRSNTGQLLFLNIALYTIALGVGGLMSNVSGFGYDQFNKSNPKEEKAMVLNKARDDAESSAQKSLSESNNLKGMVTAGSCSCYCVTEADDEKLKGKSPLEITVQSLSETVGTLKEKIEREIELAANKQKLSGKAGFLKDNLSLAYYNVGAGELLTLSLRERGGRKR